MDWLKNLSARGKTFLGAAVVALTALIDSLTDFLGAIQAASQALGG